MEKITRPAYGSPIDTIISQIEVDSGQGGVTLDLPQRELTGEVVEFLQRAAVSGSTKSLEHAGFFVYGPPGRGKTWLMSELFKAAPFPAETKQWIHFHEFFRSLQQKFGALTSTREAIDETLMELLTDTRLLFFDELHVHDPGSAALLNRLLDEITRQGIPTLITSNYEPEGLLPDLMFHHVIEPGIKSIRDNFVVSTLDGGTDYRSQSLSPATCFASGAWLVCTAAQNADDVLRDAGLTPPVAEETTTVLSDHRVLQASAVRGSEVWFDFRALLESRSTTSDYLDLADHFDTWVLTNVPRLAQTDPASRQRLVTLIDVLVDRDIQLIVCAEVPRDQLVDIPDPPTDLFRTQSRLALLRDG